MRNRVTKREVAIHEAGHIGVTLALGYHFTHAELGLAPAGQDVTRRAGPKPMRDGHTHYDEDGVRPHDYVKILMGGVVAQKIYNPCRDIVALLGRDGLADWDRAIKDLQHFHPQLNKYKATKFVAFSLADTQELLEDEWPAVLAVADVLYHKGRIDYAQAVEVRRRALTRRNKRLRHGAR